MRVLITDIYKIIYQITRQKGLSLSFAIIYISILNLVAVYGLCYLLSGWQSLLGLVLIIFRKPYIYGVCLVTILINFFMMLPLQNLSKEKGKPTALSPLIIYSVASILLFIYIQIADKIFS